MLCVTGTIRSSPTCRSWQHTCRLLNSSLRSADRLEHVRLWLQLQQESEIYYSVCQRKVFKTQIYFLMRQLLVKIYRELSLWSHLLFDHILQLHCDPNIHTCMTCLYSNPWSFTKQHASADKLACIFIHCQLCKFEKTDSESRDWTKNLNVQHECNAFCAALVLSGPKVEFLESNEAANDKDNTEHNHDEYVVA